MNEVIRLTEENPVFDTMTATTRAEKARLFNAIENPVDKISAHIGSTLIIKEIHMERAQVLDEDEGIVTDTIKTIIIDDKGDGHMAHSNGIAKSLMGIIRTFGMPCEWGDEPMEVRILQVETPRGGYFKLEVVE